MLTEDAARMMFGQGKAERLAVIARRAFQHAAMKKAAQGFGSGNPAEPWNTMIPKPSKELKTLAGTFVELQQARHQADYDFSTRLTRSSARDLVERAEAAIRAWATVRRSSQGTRTFSLEARVFLTALLIHAMVTGR